MLLTLAAALALAADPAPTASAADAIEDCRKVEGDAARRAARHITEDALGAMGEVLNLQKFYMESEKTPGEHSDQIKNLDSQFHELLYRSCGSRAYADTLTSLHRKIIKFRKASVTRHSRAMQALTEHTAIYEALCAHDGERAAQAALRHVSNAKASIERITGGAQ